MMSAQPGQAFSHWLDKRVRPTLRIGGRSRPSFEVMGALGLANALLLAFFLVTWRGLSILVLAGLVVSALATFWGLALLTKLMVGRARLTYYHHEIAILAVSTLYLGAVGQPILPYLDVTLLGVGTFLAWGRVGCLMAGCCHGRPHAWGVRYGAGHLVTGFPKYLLGVRLLPIQLVESAWVLVVVMVGSALVVAGSPAGEALAWTIVAYDLARFALEFMRGDAARPYRWGFSEAQWTSFLLVVLVVGAELAGLLPHESWHLLVAVAMLLFMVAVTIKSQRSTISVSYLMRARHLHEIARAVRNLERDQPGDPIRVESTTMGLQLSRGRLLGQGVGTAQFTISHQSNPLSHQAALALARLIANLAGHSGPYELVPGGHGVLHLILRETDCSEEAYAGLVRAYS